MVFKSVVGYCKKGFFMNTIHFMPAVKYSNQNDFKRKNVNFKGIIGDTLLKEMPKGKFPELKKVISKTKGSFGFFKDVYVKDVLESLLNALKRLSVDNSLKNAEILNLQNQLKNLENEKESLKLSLENKDGNIESLAKELDLMKLALKEKNELLQKKEQMFKVKSLNELDVPTPGEVLNIIEELDYDFEKGYKSLANYLYQGYGQEVFLKQLERINLMQKAKVDGMFNIAMIKDVLNSSHKNKKIQADSYNYALDSLRNLLILDPIGDNLESKTMREQIKNNAEALINPLKDSKYYYSNSVEKTLNDVQEAKSYIDKSCDEIEKRGLRKTGKVIEAGDLKKSYVVFKDDKRNEFYDYSIQDLMCGFLGCYRLRNYDGKILKDYSINLK